ncbi:hypothetical protein Vadar_010725 [Vaccinium darrowii]|uniref:Uncharacterized protein n=1 Tax=Vaccinium darrowii TaxID=229202 RepID=A0ACB7Z304_9ERIC|nr:hypothetical protein Vadar_010725 [Vaccinium darrowii]
MTVTVLKHPSQALMGTQDPEVEGLRGGRSYICIQQHQMKNTGKRQIIIWQCHIQTRMLKLLEGVTQYFDTMKEIGANSKSSAVFIPHGPGAVKDIASQIREGLLQANNVQE